VADKNKPGLLDTMRRRMAAEADALKAGAASAFKDAAARIREAVGPERTKPVKQPERPFGRDGGGQDVMRVVWTGHTVEDANGQRHFGAVGRTKDGYYKTAEVRTYGGDEVWRWQDEKHPEKDIAAKEAATLSDSRLRPEQDDTTRPHGKTEKEREPIHAVWRSSDIEQRLGKGKDTPRVRGHAVIGKSEQGFHTRIESIQKNHVAGVGWQTVPIYEQWSAAVPTHEEAVERAKDDLRNFNRFWAERSGTEPSMNASALFEAMRHGVEVDAAGDRRPAEKNIETLSFQSAQANPNERGKPVMAEIPENVKEQAVKAREESRMWQMKPDQEIASAQPVDNYGDRGKEMAAMQEQKREAARQENESARQEKNQPERE